MRVREVHHDITTAEELENVAYLVSRATEEYLVENNWRAYRKHLVNLTQALGLDTANV